MSRIAPVEVDKTTGKTRDMLEAVNRAFGTVPNIFRVIANAPAVLEGLQSFSRALKGGKLSAKEREQLALVVANKNNCNYCLAAHSTLGQMAGLTESEIVSSVKGESSDPRQASILSFAQAVVEKRGEVSSADFKLLMDAGVSEEEALEIVAVVVENILTNYINNVAQTPVDFTLPDAVKEVAKIPLCVK